MKIVSVENAPDYGIYEDILIPCAIYQAPSIVKKNKKLNFLEHTIYKLSKIQPSLLDNTEKLQKYLGFYAEEQSEEDYSQIIKTAVEKIKAVKLDKEEEEERILTFYQELYTGKILPVVTADPLPTTVQSSNTAFKNNPLMRKIEFKKDAKSQRKTTAYWYSVKKQCPQISVNDVISAVLKHNLKRYENYPRIELTEISKNPVKKDLVLLHVRVYFLENGEFVLTNGFSGDFSTILTDIFKTTKCYGLISALREEKKEEKSTKKKEITIPYATNDNTLKEKFSIIEESLKENPQTQNHLDRIKEKLTISLYDLIEHATKCDEKEALLYKDELYNSSFLAELAKEAGFEADEKMNIFHYTGSEGIKKNLGVMLINKSKKLKNIAKKDPEFIKMLNRLLFFRNGLKHSSKKQTLEIIDINKIKDYKTRIYFALEILLNLQRLDTKVKVVKTDFSLNNAYIDTEKSFDVEIWQKIPHEIKDMLVFVEYLLKEENFDQNRTDIINSVSTNLSAVFEYLFKDIYENFHIKKFEIKKDDIIQKYNITQNILVNVSEEKFQAALKAQNASLGAYYLLYINFYGIENSLHSLIEEILQTRGHGNISYEEAAKTDKKDLIKLFKRTKKELAKIIKEKYDG